MKNASMEHPRAVRAPILNSRKLCTSSEMTVSAASGMWSRKTGMKSSGTFGLVPQYLVFVSGQRGGDFMRCLPSQLAMINSKAVAAAVSACPRTKGA